MNTWNDIMKAPGSPEQRLCWIYDLVLNIIMLYRSDPILSFSRNDYRLKVNPDYERSKYPSSSSSIIKQPISLSFQRGDKVIRYLMEDEHNYRLLKGLSKIFNTKLNLIQREVMIRRYLNEESYRRISSGMAISERTYYRMIDEAKEELIKAYALDLYDEAGCCEYVL